MSTYELTIYRYDEKRSLARQRLDVLKKETFTAEGSLDNARAAAVKKAQEIGGATARVRTCSPGPSATKGARCSWFVVLELPKRG